MPYLPLPLRAQISVTALYNLYRPGDLLLLLKALQHKSDTSSSAHHGRGSRFEQNTRKQSISSVQCNVHANQTKLCHVVTKLCLEIYMLRQLSSCALVKLCTILFYSGWHLARLMKLASQLKYFKLT